jgi:hypothetical protein
MFNTSFAGFGNISAEKRDVFISSTLVIVTSTKIISALQI